MEPCATRRAGTGPAPVQRSYAELELLRLDDRYVYTEVPIAARDDDPKVLETRQAAAAKQLTTLLIMANTKMLNCLLRTIQNLFLSPQRSGRKDRWGAGMFLQVRIGTIFNFSPHPMN